MLQSFLPKSMGARSEIRVRLDALWAFLIIWITSMEGSEYRTVFLCAGLSGARIFFLKFRTKVDCPEALVFIGFFEYGSKVLTTAKPKSESDMHRPVGWIWERAV
jgi:hypothetical protein